MSHDAQSKSPFSLSDVGQIHMRARDLKRAVAFYRDTLGTPFLFEAPPGLAFFQCGPLTLMLGLPEAPEHDHPGSILYFRVADIDDAYEILTSRGVTFISKPHVIHRLEGKHLFMAFFRDSEENTLALMSWKAV